MKRFWLLVGCGLLSVAGLAPVHAAEQEGQEGEVKLSDREINRLDIFEDRALSKADAAFTQAQYGQAMAEYDSFLREFPNSRVTAYVLLRKGRCAQLDGKSPDAIEQYKQVTARFAKVVKYAVPALYHAAECHLANGNVDEAVKAWAAIAQDEQYGKSPLAAQAVAKLAETLAKQDKPGEALSYYERIALALGDSDSELAKQAIAAIVRQHVRTQPDEAKLKEFYKKIRPDAEDPGKSLDYWNWVQEGISANGNFGWSEREQRETYYEYWAGAMEGKFPDSDDFQIALAAIHYQMDRDKDKWTERLDEQFKKGQKEGDWKRILKWVKAYKGNWTKTKEYAKMLDFATSGVEGISQLVDLLCNEQQEHYLAKSTFQSFCENVPFEKLSNEDIHKLMLLAHEDLKDRTTAKSLAGKLNLDKMSEQDKLQLARKLLKLDGALAEPIYAGLGDKHAGQAELLEHYCREGDLSAALPILDELAGVEKYARNARLKKAELLESAKRYSEAIAALKLVDNPPDNLWRIVECHVALEDLDSAIEQLGEIERGFKDQAAKAAYRIACMYRDAEEKQKYIAALRKVIDEYPGSPEAAKAEEQYDDLGVPPALPELPPGF